jgi:gamma-glutamylcyclotransferase (GGCT)/AIG2-like uncharacterized protein YtfP
MKTIDCTTLYLPFLCKALNYTPTVLAQCITCVDDGVPVAGVIYDCYNTVIIAAHIWIDTDRKPSRAWYAAIFDYPFNRLQVRKVVGQVASDNEDATKLDEHFGFVEEARVKDYSTDGDLIIYTMTKEQCRVLNSPSWTKVVDMVRRVA